MWQITNLSLLEKNTQSVTRKANDEASLVFLFLLFDTKSTNKLVCTKIARIGFLLSEMTDSRTLRKKKTFQTLGFWTVTTGQSASDFAFLWGKWRIISDSCTLQETPLVYFEFSASNSTAFKMAEVIQARNVLFLYLFRKGWDLKPHL